MTPGSGPRHGVFYSFGRHSATVGGEITFYLVGELDSSLSAYRVFYKGGNGGMGLTRYASTKAWGESNDTVFEGNAPAEILIAPGVIRDPDVGVQILVSNRNATFFKGIANPDPQNSTKIDSDTISSFLIPKTGRQWGFRFKGLYAAGGSFPRSISLNRRGDLLAVGLQGSGRVVVYERGLKDGRLGRVVAEGEELGGVTGVVWDE